MKQNALREGRYLLRGTRMASANTTRCSFSCIVFRAQDVAWKPGLRHSKEPDLFLEVTVGKVSRKTKIVKKTLLPIWNEDIPL